MSAAALRVALVGCGRIGAHTPSHVRETSVRGWLPLSHAEAIRSTPGLELVAVCDVDASRAESTALEFGVRAFSDYRTMIEEVRPHILSIATRTPGRCDIVEFAAANGVLGLHVEKPFGRSMAECRRALKAAAAAGTALTYGTTRRWMPAYREARRLAEQDGLRDLSIEFGRAPLMWSHPHSFDLMVWFAGEQRPAAVSANCAFDSAALRGSLLDADPLVESAYVEFDGGFRGHITSAPGMTMRASGEAAAVTVAANGTRVARETRVDPRLPYFGAPQAVDFSAERSGTQEAFRALQAAVREDADSPIAADDILESCRLAFACVASALQGGRRIRPDEVPEDLTVTGRSGANVA